MTGYTPLSQRLVSSTLLKHGPDVVAVWALLLASMNRLGESDMTPETAASLLRISDDRAVAAFEILKAGDPSSRNKEHGGRRILERDGGVWEIVSAEKYQALASRAAATERQRRYQERKTKRAQARLACSAVADCEGAVSGEVDGAPVCSEHAFAPPEDVLGLGGRST